MKKKKGDQSSEQPVSTLAEVTLTKEHVKMIQGVILNMRRLKMDQEALAEDIKAVATKINVKPGEVKEMATWIIQEEEKGGVIDAKEKKIDMIRRVFELIDSGSSSAE